MTVISHHGHQEGREGKRGNHKVSSPVGSVPTTEGCHTSLLGGSEPDPLESFAIENSGQGDLDSAEDHLAASNSGQCQSRVKHLRLKARLSQVLSRSHFGQDIFQHGRLIVKKLNKKTVS